MQTPSFDQSTKGAAVLSALVIMTAVCTNLRFKLQTDFISFWAAAKLALSGNASAAYNLALHRAMETSAVAINGIIPFPYPPPYFLVILPLGLMPYAIAHAVWVGTTLSAYLAAAHKFVTNSAWLAMALPPVIICGVGGQNAFLVAAIFLAGMMLLKTRPFVSGLVFGLLIFKPHLGLLVPLALIAGRKWRTFAGAFVSSSVLMIASLVLFGVKTWTGFFSILSFAGSIATKGLVSWSKMASVYASLRLIGVSEALAWSLHGVVALCASALLRQVWRRSSDTYIRAATLAAATLTVSPYIFTYDQVLLFPALAYFWQRGGNEKWLAVLYIVALLGLAGSFYVAAPVSLAPLMPIIVLALLWRDLNADAVKSAANGAGIKRLSVPTP